MKEPRIQAGEGPMVNMMKMMKMINSELLKRLMVIGAILAAP